LQAIIRTIKASEAGTRGLYAAFVGTKSSRVCDYVAIGAIGVIDRVVPVMEIR